MWIKAIEFVLFYTRIFVHIELFRKLFHTSFMNTSIYWTTLNSLLLHDLVNKTLLNRYVWDRCR